MTDSDLLLEKINAAVKAANEAEATAEAAKTELVSRSRQVGLLLLEAKKLHPKVKDFETFLKNLQLSRAYDCMKVAGGRATDEQIRQETKERVRKHREKRKLENPRPQDSVTPPPVTERPENAPTVVRKTGNDLDPVATAEKREAEAGMSPEEREAKQSAHYLAEFTTACRLYLPKITVEADRQRARLLVFELTGRKAAA
jgi:hypothetical protein